MKDGEFTIVAPGWVRDYDGQIEAVYGLLDHCEIDITNVAYQVVVRDGAGNLVIGSTKISGTISRGCKGTGVSRTREGGAAVTADRASLIVLLKQIVDMLYPITTRDDISDRWRSEAQRLLAEIRNAIRVYSDGP